ncbi:Uncharacterised protein [Budvicia aquatica]|uniref:TrfB transcriptional repressor protein domain-containing protein n=1 Tax=Budvicia aquatica TaxID=82979 RepID=A0A484ZU86_9GAMM|nr:Uncharacterised protein [Budvicia aquatica]
MTQDEFDAIKVKLSQFSLRTVDIAEAVLVEGLTQSEAAIKYQASRQSVCGIMKRVASAIEDVPNSWKKVEVWLPRHSRNTYWLWLTRLSDYIGRQRWTQ